MNFLKRALRAVSRRKVKSLLMLVIFFVIAVLVLSGFAIREATVTAKNAARQELGATVTLQYNSQKAMEEARANMQQDSSGTGRRGLFSIQSEPVTEDMAEKVAGLANILGYNYLVNGSAMAKSFDPVEQSEEDAADDNSAGVSTNTDRPGGMFVNGNANFVMPDVSLTGVFSSELYSGFYNGNYTLVDGEHFTYAEGTRPVIIEQTLAEYNGISVNDTITVTTLESESDEDAEEPLTFELTVVGIFNAGNTDSQSAGSMGGFSMSFAQSYNTLIVDYKTAIEIAENSAGSIMGGMGSATGGIQSVVYYVDDPLNVDKVIESSAALDIDWDKFVLDANNAAYDSMIKPLNSVASSSIFFVVIVAAAGVIILSLILAMWIRERMYETGVLMSLGESKSKVAGQYVAEVFVVAIAAFALSVIPSGFISQGLGDYLLEQNSVSDTAELEGGFVTGPGGSQGPGGMSIQGRGNRITNIIGAQPGLGNVEIPDLKVSVGIITILSLFGLGILIVLGATLIPTVLVMRYKPKDILVRAG